MSDPMHLLQQAYDVVLSARAELETTRDRVASLIEKVQHMASTHDEIKDILTECESLFDTFVSAKGAGDAANADLKADATALRDKMKVAVAALSPAVAVG